MTQFVRKLVSTFGIGLEQSGLGGGGRDPCPTRPWPNGPKPLARILPSSDSRLSLPMTLTLSKQNRHQFDQELWYLNFSEAIHLHNCDTLPINNGPRAYAQYHGVTLCPLFSCSSPGAKRLHTLMAKLRRWIKILELKTKSLQK